MERVHGQARESGQEMSDEDAPVGRVILDWTDEDGRTTVVTNVWVHGREVSRNTPVEWNGMSVDRQHASGHTEYGTVGLFVRYEESASVDEL